jgi:Uma2 family endonuclease
MATAPTTGLAPIWPITVDVYHAMLERGVLKSGDPVELLEGFIVQKPVKNPPHSFATDASRDALGRVIPAGWFMREQNPVTLATSEPEPDLFISRGNRRHYRSRHPGPRDVALVMEISDTSLERDRILKKRIYAEAGIPWYWLLNLKRRLLEVYSEPKGRDYTRHEIFKPRQTVNIVLDGKVAGAVRVSELLP